MMVSCEVCLLLPICHFSSTSAVTMANDATGTTAAAAALGQRTTGRRAQRRRAREDSQQRQQINGEAPANAAASLVVSATNEMTRRKGPSEDIQNRIDAAISARAGHGVGTASATNHVLACGSGAATCTTSHEETNDATNDAARQVMMDPDIMDGARYEYLDHTADVQLHSWGIDLPSALEQLAVAMFGYMTRLPSIALDERTSDKVASHVVARGHDLHSMVFAFLDEWLFVFHDTGFVAREVEIVQFDRECWQITSRGRGEIMNLDKHPQGTEVKAITYSNMQIQENAEAEGEKEKISNNEGLPVEKRCDVWVIVDI